MACSKITVKVLINLFFEWNDTAEKLWGVYTWILAQVTHSYWSDKHRLPQCFWWLTIASCFSKNNLPSGASSWMTCSRINARKIDNYSTESNSVFIVQSVNWLILVSNKLLASLKSPTMKLSQITLRIVEKAIYKNEKTTISLVSHIN